MKRSPIISAVLAAAVLFPCISAIPALAQKQSSLTISARAGGNIKLTTVHTYDYLGRRVAFAGDIVRIEGRVSQYVPGQRVSIQVTRGLVTVHTAVRTVRRLGSRGAFTVDFPTNESGRIRVLAVHLASARQLFISSRARFDVIDPLAAPSEGGLKVRFLQHRLAALGYAISLNGVYGGATERAVMAFRKVNGMERVYTADEAVFRRVANMKGGFRTKFVSHGRHVEVDLSRQVMALINSGGKVDLTYHISSGSPYTPTPPGSFAVYLQTYGVNSLGMVDSSYFARGGYAVHGYYDIPPYAASHGCVRVPVPNAPEIYHWIRYGTPVDVYR